MMSTQQQQPLMSPISESSIRRQFEELEKRNTENFHGILAAVIVLGLLIIIGLVVGFVIVGLQSRDISKVKDEVGDIWNTLDDVKDCTEQIKDDINDLIDNVGNITMAIEEIVDDALDDFFPRPLPASRVLCAHANDIDLPNTVNVLISSNLTNTNMFTTSSIGYNVNTGAITVRTPEIESNQVVVVNFQIRVLIRDIDTGTTFSLILSTSSNCEAGNCPNGFYSTLSRFDDNNPLFSETAQWIELNTNIAIDTTQRFFVFLRSDSGSGTVFGTETDDSTACAALYISVQAMTPMFAKP